MRWIGCAFLISGWMLVLGALMMLPGLGERLGFVAAGIGVEGLGLAVFARAGAMGPER